MAVGWAGTVDSATRSLARSVVTTVWGWVYSVRRRATYWISNTLTDTLSPGQMVAIAASLKRA